MLLTILFSSCHSWSWEGATDFPWPEWNLQIYVFCLNGKAKMHPVTLHLILQWLFYWCSATYNLNPIKALQITSPFQQVSPLARSQIVFLLPAWGFDTILADLIASNWPVALRLEFLKKYNNQYGIKHLLHFKNATYVFN